MDVQEIEEYVSAIEKEKEEEAEKKKQLETDICVGL